MTWLELPKPPEAPEIHDLRDSVELRVHVGGTTSDRWRSIYNERTEAEKVRAVALGTEDRTVLLIRVPIETRAEDVAAALSRAEELLAETDWACKAEEDQLWSIQGAIRVWYTKRAG
jgi:hypothetical protein